MGLVLGGSSPSPLLIGYCDSNYTNDPSTEALKVDVLWQATASCSEAVSHHGHLKSKRQSLTLLVLQNTWPCLRLVVNLSGCEPYCAN